MIVRDGKAIEPNLRRERLTLDEVLAEARLQHFPSLEEIAWAVLETDGKISFVPKTA